MVSVPFLWGTSVQLLCCSLCASPSWRDTCRAAESLTFLMSSFSRVGRCHLYLLPCIFCSSPSLLQLAAEVAADLKSLYFGTH